MFIEPDSGRSRLRQEAMCFLWSGDIHLSRAHGPPVEGYPNCSRCPINMALLRRAMISIVKYVNALN